MSGVSISRAAPRGMISLKVDLTAPACTFALKKAVGLAVPKPCCATMNDEAAAIWMAPDELLVLCPRDTVELGVRRLTSAMGDAHFLAVDVSDARVIFTLTGEDAMVREVLARLTPADMHPASFTAGHVRRTRLAQVATAIWIKDGTADVFVFRSVSDYVGSLLENAAESPPVGHF